ncbi:hypothetical protein [Yoonia sp. SS1-5]|uniref:Uncharacterized protein n=1 Tax=Yoonia rhodophyticola TaxID=3137370 RepID=A0AAN0NKU3_9RHOB
MLSLSDCEPFNMIPKSLFALLDTTEIIHPTSVRELRISDGTAVMEIDGFPWWLPFEDAKKIQEGSATIEFDEILRAKLTESCLASVPLSKDPCSEDLEEFSITNLAQATWNKVNSTEVFCSEPLNDPLAFLTSLDRFLTDTECPFGHSEFVNCGEALEKFVSLSKLDMFQIAKGPDAICQMISEELNRQGVKHTTTQTDVSYATGFLVLWWDGFLICKGAKIYWS